MKAGEYIGKDRKQYTVTHLTVLEKPFIRATSVKHDGDGVLYGSSTIVHITQDHPDWPAAKAALDALIAAEQDAEWVEWPVGGDRFRIRPDGSAAQWDDGEDWAEEREDIDWVIAYRKGREVKEAEDAALREQVKALVEALFEVERGEEPPHTEWDDVLDMARRLGEVLSSVTGKVSDSDALDGRWDSVRALVDAIGKPYSISFTPDMREKPYPAECAYYQIEPTGMVRVDGVREMVEWAARVQEAAMRVQL